jgi:sister-chromatid-cohesion protein PDS5
MLQTENPAAHQLAQALLKREAEVLRNPLQQFLLSVMLKGKSDSDLKKDYHDIIYEVYRSAPQLLLTVLPNLEGELQVRPIEAGRL